MGEAGDCRLLDRNHLGGRGIAGLVLCPQSEGRDGLIEQEIEAVWAVGADDAVGRPGLEAPQVLQAEEGRVCAGRAAEAEVARTMPRKIADQGTVLPPVKEETGV